MQLSRRHEKSAGGGDKSILRVETRLIGQYMVSIVYLSPNPERRGSLGSAEVIEDVPRSRARNGRAARTRFVEVELPTVGERPKIDPLSTRRRPARLA